MLSVGAQDPGTPDAAALLADLSAALAAITGDSGQSSFDAADVRVPGACFAVARDAAGQAVGCGALRPLADGIAELKRMYARPGSGAGSALLAFLEHEAAALTYRAIWLSTRAVNARALRFYRAHGFVTIPNYGKYAGRADSVCLAKQL